MRLCLCWTEQDFTEIQTSLRNKEYYEYPKHKELRRIIIFCIEPMNIVDVVAVVDGDIVVAEVVGEVVVVVAEVVTEVVVDADVVGERVWVVLQSCERKIGCVDGSYTRQIIRHIANGTQPPCLHRLRS